MTEQGDLLVLMIKNELKKKPELAVSISNHLYDTPKEIKFEADEIVFVSFIKIQATSDFEFEFKSGTERRIIAKTMAAPMTIENNLVTKHLNNIKFSMSNTDKYEVSIVKLKFIK